ncbi:hypothetical protein FNV43_RR27216 [Rhamnella rubrinervis]|uniref:RNase H type-1 domain-containing protein n=1 Tax=Rhamnella rubrinervis TaxID=2594499 RepID=A0A8K0GPH2_9ROSA|nr:hypothetical protein FNV43_RR27216 [Rhamnella rubrinervis]
MGVSLGRRKIFGRFGTSLQVMDHPWYIIGDLMSSQSAHERLVEVLLFTLLIDFRGRGGGAGLNSNFMVLESAVDSMDKFRSNHVGNFFSRGSGATTFTPFRRSAPARQFILPLRAIWIIGFTREGGDFDGRMREFGPFIFEAIRPRYLSSLSTGRQMWGRRIRLDASGSMVSMFEGYEGFLSLSLQLMDYGHCECTSRYRMRAGSGGYFVTSRGFIKDLVGSFGVRLDSTYVDNSYASRGGFLTYWGGNTVRGSSIEYCDFLLSQWWWVSILVSLCITGNDGFANYRILTDLARGIETPLKIDNTTLLGNFGHYTRVLVDMDLSGFVPEKLLLETTDDCIEVDVDPPSMAVINTEIGIEVQPFALNLGATPSKNDFNTKVDAFGDSEDVHDDYADERVVNEWPPLHGQRASKPLKKFDGMPNVGHQSNVMAIILVMLDSFGTLNAAQQNLNLVASQPLVFNLWTIAVEFKGCKCYATGSLDYSCSLVSLPIGYLKVNIDGCLGPAKCDVYFVTSRSFIKGSFAVPLDLRYAFVSELLGVISAIECARDFRWDHLWLKCNSTYVAYLLIRQEVIVSWAYKTRWVNCPRHIFSIYFWVSNIFREENIIADALLKLIVFSFGATWWWGLLDSCSSMHYRNVNGFENYKFRK